MKRLYFIFSILLTVIVLISCENGNVKKLKKEITIANVSCPINMGSAGDLLSIKYQEKENRVIIYFSINEEVGNGIFLKKNKDKMKKQLQLLFSQNESNALLKDILNAQASVMVIYKAPSSGKTIKFELRYEELKNLQQNPLSNKEIERMIIDNKVDIENSTCPYKLEEGITTSKVAIVNNFIVYYYEMDENIFDINEIQRNQSEMKKMIVSGFKSMRNDPSFQRDLQLIISNHLGYQYRCYGNKSKAYVDIIFPPEELIKYARP